MTITSNCKNEVMRDQLNKALSTRRKARRASWPRLKGPRAVRIDCKTGYAVATA